MRRNSAHHETYYNIRLLIFKGNKAKYDNKAKYNKGDKHQELPVFGRHRKRKKKEAGLSGRIF